MFGSRSLLTDAALGLLLGVGASLTAGFPEAQSPGAQPKITKLSDFSAEALGELTLYLSQHVEIPIVQVLGFSQIVPQRAGVATAETTTSTTFTDLTTTGPTLAGLSDGKYLVFTAAALGTDTAGKAALMGPSFNGATPIDDNAAIAFAVSLSSLTCTSVGVAVVTLTNGGNNTIQAKYRVNGGTGTFTYRNLVAIRMANP